MKKNKFAFNVATMRDKQVLGQKYLGDKCNKCDERGMIQDDKYSAHSCSCGKNNRLMEESMKDVKIEDLLAYGRARIEQKKKLL
jgi:hypothetical protein